MSPTTPNKLEWGQQCSLPQENSDQLYLNVNHPDPILIVYDVQSADASQPSIFAPLFFYSIQSLCLMHTGKPTGVAVSHCITWFQIQLILTACQIRYHTVVGSS